MICKDGNENKNDWFSVYNHKEWGKGTVIKVFFNR